MRRADGNLFEVLADHVCRDLLVAFLESGTPLTQRQLISELGISSGVVSRRMGELETLGLIERESAHGPYQLTFPEETQRLLEDGATLAAVALDRLARQATEYAWKIRARRSEVDSEPAEERA